MLLDTIALIDKIISKLYFIEYHLIQFKCFNKHFLLSFGNILYNNFFYIDLQRYYFTKNFIFQNLSVVRM